MRRKVVCLLLFLATLFFTSAGMAETSGSELEAKKLQSEFGKNIGSRLPVISKEDALEKDYLDKISRDALKILSVKAAGQSQYFVYVDRNPDKQVIVVGFFDAARQNITIIGVDRVSTGNQKRRGGYFITPTGVFEHSRDYRALGTKNAKGWRGLGIKDSRVWDFGWQKTSKNNQPAEIRLLMHATDPDYGEPRLGRVASKGCVRISSKLNKFLDYYGILDSRGKYLLIGDSADIK